MAEVSTIGQPIPLGVVEPSDAPLVDEALAQPREALSDAAADQVAALKAEIASLSASLADMTDNARKTVRAKANAVEAVVDETVRLHPVLSVLTAAGTGYALALLLHGPMRHR